jgi:hypothetical protein
MGCLISHLPNNFLSHALSVRALEISQSRVQISLGVNLKLCHLLVVFMRGREGFRFTPLPYAPFTPVFLSMSDMWQLKISRAEIKKSQVMQAT